MATGPSDPLEPGAREAALADLRKHERTPVTLIVDYDGPEDFLSDYTVNLSSGGTFIHTSRTLAVGTDIQLVLSFPGLLESVSISGTVRWSRAGGEPGVGVEFFAGPAADKLATIVERIQCRDPRTVAPIVRVLVVEDNSHVSDLIVNGLHASARRSFADELAFTFAVADNGAAALEFLRTETFDAAIIDVYMPMIDGAQVIEQARGELGLKTLPIIAVSAGGELARRTALAAGANMFIDKPMRLRQVIDTMRQLVKLRGL